MEVERQHKLAIHELARVANIYAKKFPSLFAKISDLDIKIPQGNLFYMDVLHNNTLVFNLSAQLELNKTDKDKPFRIFQEFSSPFFKSGEQASFQAQKVTFILSDLKIPHSRVQIPENSDFLQGQVIVIPFYKPTESKGNALLLAWETAKEFDQEATRIWRLVDEPMQDNLFTLSEITTRPPDVVLNRSIYSTSK